MAVNFGFLDRSYGYRFHNLASSFNGRENVSVVLGEEHILRVSVKRVLSRILGHKENDVIRESRKIRIERLHILFFCRTLLE
jgi:hypothetical protein